MAQKSFTGYFVSFTYLWNWHSLVSCSSVQQCRGVIALHITAHIAKLQVVVVETRCLTILPKQEVKKTKIIYFVVVTLTAHRIGAVKSWCEHNKLLRELFAGGSWRVTLVVAFVALSQNFAKVMGNSKWFFVCESSLRMSCDEREQGVLPLISRLYSRKIQRRSLVSLASCHIPPSTALKEHVII